MSSTVRVCPKCGSNSVSTERRIDGNSTCGSCKMYTHTKDFLIIDSDLIIDGFYPKVANAIVTEKKEDVSELTYEDTLRAKIGLKLYTIIVKDFNIMLDYHSNSRTLKDIGLNFIDIHELYLCIDETFNIEVDLDLICDDDSCTITQVIDIIYKELHD